MSSSAPSVHLSVSLSRRLLRCADEECQASPDGTIRVAARRQLLGPRDREEVACSICMSFCFASPVSTAVFSSGFTCRDTASALTVSSRLQLMRRFSLLAVTGLSLCPAFLTLCGICLDCRGQCCGFCGNLSACGGPNGDADPIGQALMCCQGIRDSNQPSKSGLVCGLRTTTHSPGSLFASLVGNHLDQHLSELSRHKGQWVGPNFHFPLVLPWVTAHLGISAGFGFKECWAQEACAVGEFPFLARGPNQQHRSP